MKPNKPRGSRTVFIEYNQNGKAAKVLIKRGEILKMQVQEGSCDKDR